MKKADTTKKDKAIWKRIYNETWGKSTYEG